jgi:hypothetical protein
METQIKNLEERIEKLEKEKLEKVKKKREPREPTAWQLYLKSEGAIIKAENEKISQAEIMKICAQRWSEKNKI